MSVQFSSVSEYQYKQIFSLPLEEKRNHISMPVKFQRVLRKELQTLKILALLKSVHHRIDFAFVE